MLQSYQSSRDPVINLQMNIFNKISSKNLSLLFLLFGSLLALVLYYPISLIFSGNVKLNQQIELFNIEQIWFLGVEIPIGSISVRFYSICILLGLLAGYFLTLHLAKKHFIASTTIDRLFIGLLLAGLVGARLFYALFSLDKFIQNPLEIATEITRGGIAIYGAIIAGTIQLYFYSKKYKFNLFELLDVIAPGVLIGQVIGRFGNFFNYEAYGGPTSVYWKMFVPQTANIYEDFHQKYFHPTFLYEIIPNYILFLIILANYDKLTHRKSGLVFAIYAIGYGIIRFFVEFFRLDALRINFPEYFIPKIGPFSFEYIAVSQISSLILIFVGTYVILKRRKTIYLKRNMNEVSV